MQMSRMRRARVFGSAHGEESFQSGLISTFMMKTRGVSRNYKSLANPEYLQRLVILRVVTKKNDSVSIFKLNLTFSYHGGSKLKCFKTGNESSLFF